MLKEPIRKSILLAFLYLIFGSLWILLSDFITFNKWVDDPEILTKIQTRKGILFVFISSVLVGVLGYFLNFRRLKMIELKEHFLQKLRHELDQKQLLLNSSSDAIVSCDENGNIMYFNEKFKEWFHPVEELNIKDWPKAYNMKALFEERTLESNEVCLAIALETGIVVNHKYRVVRNNHERVIEANGSILKGSDNQASGALVIMRDISERIVSDDKKNSIILDAIDNERSEIAAEIHDSITQQIASVYYNLLNIKARNTENQIDETSIDKAISSLNTTIKECRNISRSLVPVSIPEFGLNEALEGLADQFSLKSNLKVTIDYNLNKELSSYAELQLYRIIQQACMNSIEHSECNRIDILLKEEADGSVYISISDNGKGFDTSKTNSEGIGLLSMRNRAKSLKGTFDLSSTTEQGTEIIIRLPARTLEGTLGES